MPLVLASSPEVFTTAHIGLTAAITGVLALAVAVWRLPRAAWADMAAVAVLSAASVYLWRTSANMTQLNTDGLPSFSANDWAAPVLTYVFLSLYADVRLPADPRRYAQTRALATLVSLAVNVITI
ncbi:hypothetical protein AV521_44175 [Streptomyces sp. IMTB 2501]|uniref:hypothetical protein n=1 Tax=Streptomyces sp. IMTB 2501 TaxID=1776340 RepID=UPI00096DEF1D|nr:hypothetical protein [Streptomyces sp. IMTB 2501]OLZ61213.1 hypothetical protein AV521_44175 [Streptomyces sp. IMTB 2501]